MCRFKNLAVVACALFVGLGPVGLVSAQDGAEATEPTVEEQLAELTTATDDAALAGHNAWMLTCTALVLFMTAPGLAMFYSGLVRKKNVLGVMMQCLFLMGLMTVIWGLWGYSLSFGDGGPYVGNGDYLFMNRVQRVLG